ncbi:myo-inositol-1(or 4)-monophosphatase [Rhodobium orientis]|nr:histidinol-phosphatase [Rhodobium orientis]MBB4302915.1 myo-inositol-1(or 4)-monophosphatase [Rhodobium orientis]
MADMLASDQLKFFCEALAKAASDEILPRFRNLVRVDNKDENAFDPVTEADRAAEAAMRRLIAERFPEDGIDGEEHGLERGDAEAVWILDPIDGTRGFIVGLPTWGVLIGRMEGGRPRIGMMHQPFVGETFFGDCETAVLTRAGIETPLRTRPCPDLADAALLSTGPDFFSDEERPAFEAVSREAKLTRFGTDCYGYCVLAAGQADLVVEAGLKIQDIAPLIPIVEGAGGVVTDWSGGPAGSGGQVVASGDPRLHEQVLKKLSG